MVYRMVVFAKLNTGAYLIAVFAFGVASMAMDRVFDAMWVKNNIEPISALVQYVRLWRRRRRTGYTVTLKVLIRIELQAKRDCDDNSNIKNS
jgi:hypothetical protein